LRAVFEPWGLPQRLRLDNGRPWGNEHAGKELPPPLVLWCVGLGILPIWNHPYSPTENPFVERQNGTVQRWGDPERCANYATWQETLAWVTRTQREVYRPQGGPTRVEAHPELLTNPRRYEAAREEDVWQLARVIQYLAGYAWPRLVSQRGQISVYGKAYEVGSTHGGKQVWLRLEAATTEWVIQDGEGQELARHAAEQLTAERIVHLQVSKPHASGHSPKRSRQRVENGTLRNAA
jgi:hypothetical protein